MIELPMLPFLISAFLSDDKITPPGRYPVVRTRSDSTIPVLANCDLIALDVGNGKTRNFYQYELKDFEWHTVTKLDYVYDKTGRRYEVVSDSGYYVTCYSDGNHYVLPKTHLMYSSRGSDVSDTPITSVIPKKDMASKLSQRLNNDYLTAEKEKQILDRAKQVKSMIESMEQEREALREKESKLSERIDLLQKTYDCIEDAFEIPDPEIMENLLAMDLENIELPKGE